MKEKSVRFVVFGIVLVLLASGIGTVSAFSNSGDGDWKYYKEITVKENSGEMLTDFQVLVELNPSNFPANANSDGSDLRFEDTNSKELNYWIEEWNYGTKEAKIWVKVPSIPANGETKIRMYYGNPSASAVSDGDKVFEFFDDFESGSVSDRWLVTRGTFEASTDYAVSGTYAGKWCGGYSHPIHEGAYFDFGLRTNDFVLEYLYRDGGADEGAVFGTCHDTSFSWDLWGPSMLYDWKNTLICRDASDTDHTVVDPFKDVWYKFKETHHPSTKTYDLEIDSGDTYSGVGLEYHEQKNPQYFKIIDPSSASRSIVTYVEDILVRKYTSPEPTFFLSPELPIERKPKFEISGPYIIPKFLSPNRIVDNALLGTYIDNEIKLGISNDEYVKKVICKFKSPAGFIAVQELELSKTGGLVKADGYEYYNYEGEIKARNLKPLIGWLISFFGTGFSSHADAHEALIDFTPPVTLEKVIITDVYGAEHELDVNKPLVSIEDQIFNPSPINPAFLDYKYVATYSPVHILMTDEEGNKIGWEECNEFKEIENAVYSGADIHPEFIIIFQPKLTYSLNVSGVKSGDFTLHIVSANATAKTVSKFEKISATANTKAFIQITEKVQEMSVDYDGDGKIDEEKEPASEVIEVIPEIPTPSPSPTPTPPGFEVIFAIAGLLAVAYVLRRKK